MAPLTARTQAARRLIAALASAEMATETGRVVAVAGWGAVEVPVSVVGEAAEGSDSVAL